MVSFVAWIASKQALPAARTLFHVAELVWLVWFAIFAVWVVRLTQR